MQKNHVLRTYILVFGICLLLPTAIKSQNEKELSPQDSVKKKKTKRLFELSLGQTLLFISDNKLEIIKDKSAIVVPTSAKLFFAEFRPVKKMKIPVFFNLPTEAKQFIVDGVLVSERASPTFGTGLQLRVFKFPLGVKSAIELEMGPLASFLISEKAVLRFAPVGAGRLQFIKNEDFVLYFGGSYSAGINAFGILFGIGYVF
ncbi:MAG: hypothetical protein H0U95_12190 [Bacteroidetes bacterium]|nr:hypothetical protein [Bacteroidota bacterium]